MPKEPEDHDGQSARKGEKQIAAKASVWRFRWWLVILIALCVVAGSAYWLSHRQAPAVYTTAAISRGPVSRQVTATGSVNPVLTVLVGSYVSGVIQAMYCDFNTQVHKGQVCAKIDPRPYQTIVNQVSADLADARAQLAKDQAGLTYAGLAYARDLQLVKQGIVSQDVVDSAKNSNDQAKAQIAVDAAVIQQKQAALQSAQVSLGYTDIVSPVDGTVVSRNITMGQTVAASFQTPTLFLIATDLTSMQVDTNVSESDLADLREGDKAVFSVEAYPSRTFAGVVTQIRQAPQTVQNVVTYDVIVATQNKALLLKPGMTATVGIITDQRDNVLRIPDQALRFAPSKGESETTSGAGAHVWLLRDGRPMRVGLTLGLDDNSYSEVLKGEIKPGDQVIVGEKNSASGTASGGSQPRLPHM